MKEVGISSDNSNYRICKIKIATIYLYIYIYIYEEEENICPHLVLINITRGELKNGEEFYNIRM